MADKLPFFAAESGTWKTTSPNPHIDLSGTALVFGTYPVQTFKAAADDATLDFATTNTCTVVAWVDAANWRRYEGAVWTDATPDTLNLSAATLMGAVGTISADASVSVVASLPSTVDHGALLGLTDNDHPQYEILHGVAAAGALSFDNSTHIVTMASGTNTYWFQGAKYTTAAVITCDLDSYVTLTTNTLYYVAFDDASGTLKASATPWSLTTKVPVAMVFWNGSAGALTYECHNHTRDLDWHAWAHLTVGARYGSGLTQTLPSTAVDGSLQIESGTIYDEDIAFTVAQQTTMRGWYQASAGVYTFADYALPYLGTAGAPVFLDTDTYALSSFANNNYVCYWAYAAPDMARPIYVVPSQRAAAYGTVALARAEAAPSLSALNLSPEMKLVYRWIYAGDGQYQEGADYRLTSPLPSGGSASTTAGAVSFAPAGNIAATTVQAAIEELDAEKLSSADGSVTLAKLANLAQDQFIGRVTASTGVPETATITAAARTVLDDATVGGMVDTLGGATSTGSGGIARATSPTFVTPILGTPTSGTLTNCTGLPISAIDLDGGTDIGADLADADLILVDDGAGGTNRKAAMSRVKTYIGAEPAQTAASQAEMETGTESAIRSMSPLRVAQAATAIGSRMQCRLSVSSSDPAPTADTSASTLYLLGYTGTQSELWDGTSWRQYTTNTASIAISGLTADLPYDVYLYLSTGTPTLELVAWTSGTARATALAWVDGRLVKSGTGAKTHRFLGTIAPSAADTISDTTLYRGIANYYNPVNKIVLATLPSTPHSYTTGTYREYNNGTSVTRGKFVLHSTTALTLQGYIWGDAVGSEASAVIDSTTASSDAVYGRETSSTSVVGVSGLVSASAGYHYLTMIEYGASGADFGYGRAKTSVPT